MSLPPIPFHIAPVTDEEVDAVVATLRSGWLTTGPAVRAFEAEFASAVGAAHAVALNSATAALHLALEAIGLRAGDEVVVPAMTFAATAEVVRYFGARPVLVDCDPHTLNIRAEDVASAITARTRAIIPVHMAGLACDLGPLLTLAADRGLTVIDDAAHAFPSTYGGAMIGGVAPITAFSFYATKTLTTGEGGMLTTNDAAIADRVRIMALHGISRHAWNRYSAAGTWRYDILAPGYKYNLTDIAASIGRVQLRRSAALLAERQRVAARYDAAFAGTDLLTVPARSDDRQHAWHLYPVQLNLARVTCSRDAVIEWLKAEGIGTSVHFIPLHLHSYYRETYGYTGTEFPHAEQAFLRLISLPIYPGLTDAQVDRVSGTLLQHLASHRR